jgi:hypothetical protein
LLSKVESENILQKTWEEISRDVPKKNVPYIGLEQLYDITLVVYDALISSDQNKLGLVDQYLDEKIRKIGEYEFDIHTSIRRAMAYNEMIAIEKIFHRTRYGKDNILPVFETENNLDRLRGLIANIIKSGDIVKAEKLKKYIDETSIKQYTSGKTGFNFSELCTYGNVLLGFINAIKKTK